MIAGWGRVPANQGRSLLCLYNEIHGLDRPRDQNVDRDAYALAKEVTAKHIGLAIRLCSAAGVPLATFFEGAEVEYREIGFVPFVPQRDARIGFDDVQPAFFEPGQWDRNAERFTSKVTMDERMPLSQLRLFLG